MSEPDVLTSYRRVIRFDALHWGERGMRSMIRRELDLSAREYRRVLRAAVADPAISAEFPDETRRILYRMRIGDAGGVNVRA